MRRDRAGERGGLTSEVFRIKHAEKCFHQWVMSMRGSDE